VQSDTIIDTEHFMMMLSLFLLAPVRTAEWKHSRPSKLSTREGCVCS